MFSGALSLPTVLGLLKLALSSKVMLGVRPRVLREIIEERRQVIAAVVVLANEDLRRRLGV
jgi:hypothetical protein